MELALFENFLLAMIAIVNPLGKVPVWVEASAGCDAPVRLRLAIFVTGTALALLAVFLFFGRSILEFLSIDLPAFRVGGGIIILLIGIRMLHGDVVDLETEKSDGDSPFDRAKARFRNVVVPMSVPILAGPGSITTAILFGTQAGDDWTTLLILGAILSGVMLLVLGVLLAGHRIEALVGSLVLGVQTRIWGLLLTAIAAQLILVGLGESFPSWLEQSSPVADDVRESAASN